MTYINLHTNQVLSTRGCWRSLLQLDLLQIGPYTAGSFGENNDDMINNDNI